MVVEGALKGEIDDHLGYEKHNSAGRDGRAEDKVVCPVHVLV